MRNESKLKYGDDWWNTSDEINPYDKPEVYYGPDADPINGKKAHKLRCSRTLSLSYNSIHKKSNFISLAENECENKQSIVSDNYAGIQISKISNNKTNNENFDFKSNDKKDEKIILNITSANKHFEKKEIENNIVQNEICNRNDHSSKKNRGFRRDSLCSRTNRPLTFYIDDIDSKLKELLKHEDTDNNYQITVDDNGPKVHKLGTANSNGYNNATIKGTYKLSNLLQELTLAKQFGRNKIYIDERRLNENPLFRMKRLIITFFWKNLTRVINEKNIFEVAEELKIFEVDKNKKKINVYRIYVPYNRKDQFEFFSSIKSKKKQKLIVEYLPQVITDDYITSINRQPGLLSLATYPNPNDSSKLLFYPYIIPGGRFNEFYGWDSYFIAIGLLIDSDFESEHNLSIVRGIIENFFYEIEHYGKILNANRSYYLGRSQPPFLTDICLRYVNKYVDFYSNKKQELLDFLKRVIYYSIKEYKEVWVSKPRFDDETTLSAYHPTSSDIPIETEIGHFKQVLSPYLQKYKVSEKEFIELYNKKKIKEPDLEEYFLHDKATRESGHDTTYRFENKCSNLATIDLNSTLYKYEVDISYIIKKYFDDSFMYNGELQTSSIWLKKAEARKNAIFKYLWNENDSIFYDYDLKLKKQTNYESVTTFWSLWAGFSTKDQAEKMIKNTLPKFENLGGLVSTTKKSRGNVDFKRPSRQWDYPYGWAPHQMLAWIGLSNYGYEKKTNILIYRWIYMIMKVFVDYNGVIVEKYDVTKLSASHKIDVEYGNQGLEFKSIVQEGFGWVNASYLFGLSFLDTFSQRCLETMITPDVYLEKMNENKSL